MGARSIIRCSQEGDALQAAMEGARKAHVEQLRKQERALEKALQPLEPEDSEEEAEAWVGRHEIDLKGH